MSHLLLESLPEVLAMTIADAAHRDGATGKFSLLGTFNAIAARSFPHVHPCMAVYLALTDGRGKTPLTLRLIDADEEEAPIFQIQATVDFPDPLQMVEVAFSCPRLEFRHAGEYRLQLFAGDEPLMERRLLVMSSQQMSARLAHQERHG
jgi:hypothetical protein